MNPIQDSTLMLTGKAKRAGRPGDEASSRNTYSGFEYSVPAQPDTYRRANLFSVASIASRYFFA